MRGPWGPVYGPIDLEIPTGGVTALIGTAGPGRTALLMTVAGRMKPSSGTLTVLGSTAPTEIFAHSALAGIEELDTVAESVRVRDLITEQLRWDAPWYRLVGRAGHADLEAVCRPVFGSLPLPHPDEYVEQLTELDGLLLRIALANTARPPLLVVGNLDQVTSHRNHDALVRRLVELGTEQTVITSSANDLPDELGVRTQLRVANLSHAELVARTQEGQD
nr:ATP-binding cassette domain-containing protein [Mycolicibacillus koreensis]